MVSIHKIGRISRLEKAKDTKRLQVVEAIGIAGASPEERYAHMCQAGGKSQGSKLAEISTDDAERIYREVMK